MKTKTISLLAALSLAGVLSPAHAASYTEAQFTRLENEVKVLKENSAPHSAAVGENVSAVTSVATGANSRAELRFPDKSLTRLGANSRFTIRGEERTLDLDKGVMMLQVPKEMGGAKVRTAAVTAAVTGTTVIFEYLPNGYIKLIVVEGTVDFFSNKHRSHFQTVHAGQMIITNPNSSNIPPPVDIDLRRLLRTSRLLKQFENMPNAAYVKKALKNQLAELKNGTLVETNLVIPGLGTFVAFSRNETVGLNDGLIFPGFVPVKAIPGVPPPPPPNNNGSPPVVSRPPPVPPHLQGFLPLIAGTTVLNRNSSITTDNPQVTAYNSGTNGLLTSSGAIYHGQAADGPLNLFAFGSKASPSRIFQTFLNDNSSTWSTFKFDSLLINGAPKLTTDQVNDLLLVANNDITLSNNDTSFPSAGGGSSCAVSWDLPGFEETGHAISSALISGSSTTLDDLALYSHTGSINFSHFSLNGGLQNIALDAAGVKSDVNFNNHSELDTGGNVVVTAAQNVNVQNSHVSGSNVQIFANQNIDVSGKSKVIADGGNLIVRALNGIQISDSATLKQFASEGCNMTVLRIQAKNGPVVVTQNSTLHGNAVSIQAVKGGGTALDGVAPGNILISDSSVKSGNGVGVRTLAAGGTLTFADSKLNASRGIRLYAAGQGGTVIFTQDTTLNGNFLTLAGTTVEVASGVTVTVDNSHVHIFTDNALYNTSGYGTIQYGSTPVGQTSAFAKRPRFHGPPPIPGKGPGFPPPKPGVLGMPPPKPINPLPASVVTPMAVTPPTTVTPVVAPAPPTLPAPTGKGV